MLLIAVSAVVLTAVLAAARATRLREPGSNWFQIVDAVVKRAKPKNRQFFPSA
jgi:hypothetical protein